MKLQCKLEAIITAFLVLGMGYVVAQTLDFFFHIT